MSLREIKALRKLNHPNIVKLKEVIRVNNDLYLVFEYMQGNVYEMIKEGRVKGLSDDKIKSVLFQTMQGLANMHEHGIFHRDLKPENLLFYNGQVKIADFGLSKDIVSVPPHTDYVSTRWYRAPEILLHSTTYNAPVDIFAMGCIASELFTG
jgi:serine/threonine protein kinase